jgi:predicted RNA-binding protein YlxR (DUF448 family)
MIRLVRTPEGQLVIDETGKVNGRGAYICRQRSCWQAVLQGNQLSRALKMEIGEAEERTLEQYWIALAS